MANYNQKVKKQLKARKGKFTQIPNEIFDVAISPKAKLIWIYILSLPKDRDICRNYIGKKFGISKGTMTKIIHELQSNGLLDVRRKGERSDFTLHEVPEDLLFKGNEDHFLVQPESQSEPARTEKQPSKDQKKALYKDEYAIHNTAERKRSGKYRKTFSSKDMKSTSPKSSRKSPNSISPEQCLDPMSAWYQWLINKHGLIASHFPTLTFEERLAWATKYGPGSDKEEFIDQYLRHYSLISGILPDSLDI